MRSGGIVPPFLTSAVGGGEWSASRPGRFTPGENAPGIHLIGSWLGLEACLEVVEKRKMLPLSGIEHQPSSPYPTAIPTELSRPLVK
jgi:hypothetical protein